MCSDSMSCHENSNHSNEGCCTHLEPMREAFSCMQTLCIKMYLYIVSHLLRVYIWVLELNNTSQYERRAVQAAGKGTSRTRNKEMGNRK